MSGEDEKREGERRLAAHRAQAIIRGQGLCGHLLDDEHRVCILPKQHDNGAHNRGWTVHRVMIKNAYARDSREDEIAVFRVLDGRTTKRFETDNSEHAEWLASTLSRLDL